MWQQTERLALVWFRITLALAVGVAVVMTVYGLGSVQFKLAAVAAVVADLLIVRRLCREWPGRPAVCGGGSGERPIARPARPPHDYPP